MVRLVSRGSTGMALGLGTVMVGAFDDQNVKTLLGIEEEPLAIMPVGRPPD